MRPAKSIYLVGMMGSGKTTIGKQLAKALQMPFFDSDKEIEEMTGVNIPTIFEYEGEAGFREREQAMIRQLTSKNGIVLATGGGVINSRENREMLCSHGFVVYLQCSIDKILLRTKRDKQRPLLNTDNPRLKLQELEAARTPLYRVCADFKIDTGELSTKTVIKKIIGAFQFQDRLSG